MHITRFYLQNELQTVLCVFLLVEIDVAVCTQQVTVFDSLVDRWQVCLKIGRGRLNRVEAV